MRSSRCQRHDMMYFGSSRDPTFALAYLAQRMRSNVPAPDTRPFAIIPALHFRRPSVTVVLRRDQLLMRWAICALGQFRTARIAARPSWFPRHMRLHSKNPLRIQSREGFAVSVLIVPLSHRYWCQTMSFTAHLKESFRPLAERGHELYRRSGRRIPLLRRSRSSS